MTCEARAAPMFVRSIQMSSEPKQAYIIALREQGFVLGNRIGSGAFGTVYCGTQQHPSRHVAVKFFDNDMTKKNADNHKRFTREADLLARINHPGVPYVLTTGIVDSVSPAVPYLVMQYVEGRRLDKLLQERGRLELDLALLIACCILHVLDAVHAAHIIHRDIKPDNIILGKFGIYLIDFSIGFCRDYAPGLTRATRAGTRLGVPDYASPEQQRDASSVDHRTDIYSTGVILYEMLSGSSRIHPALLDERLPRPIGDVVRKACNSDPSQRFQSAIEFLDSLDEVSRGSISPLKKVPVALCPGPVCEAAVWSQRGYYWGPRIIRDTDALFCDSCGTTLVRSCRNCGANLPEHIDERVVQSTRSDPDRTSAYCKQCGHSLFITPTCQKCGSLLQLSDMSTDTDKSGCKKCSGVNEM